MYIAQCKSLALACYRTEENFGGKILWQSNLTGDLAKKTLANSAKSSGGAPNWAKGVRTARKYSCN